MTAAIVLAAGKSRRMGTQKLLLPVHGRPLIVHVVSEITRAGVIPIITVLSPDSPAVAEALVPFPVTPAFNTDPAGDMLSSIRCGLRALPPDCSQFLIVPADQPGLTADLLSRLITIHQNTGKSLTVPVCQGRRGHPVLISAVHRDEILTRHDGTGLRGLFQDHPDNIAEIPVDDPNTLEDMDLPEDYERLSRALDQAK